MRRLDCGAAAINVRILDAHFVEPRQGLRFIRRRARQKPVADETLIIAGSKYR